LLNGSEFPEYGGSEFPERTPGVNWCISGDKN
jgi:hypothetical protein